MVNWRDHFDWQELTLLIALEPEDHQHRVHITYRESTVQTVAGNHYVEELFFVCLTCTKILSESASVITSIEYCFREDGHG